MGGKHLIPVCSEQSGTFLQYNVSNTRGELPSDTLSLHESLASFDYFSAKDLKEKSKTCLYYIVSFEKPKIKLDFSIL
jgi:hypothetical protein